MHCEGASCDNSGRVEVVLLRTGDLLLDRSGGGVGVVKHENGAVRHQTPVEARENQFCLVNSCTHQTSSSISSEASGYTWALRETGRDSGERSPVLHGSGGKVRDSNLRKEMHSLVRQII